MIKRLWNRYYIRRFISTKDAQNNQRNSFDRNDVFDMIGHPTIGFRHVIYQALASPIYIRDHILGKNCFRLCMYQSLRLKTPDHFVLIDDIRLKQFSNLSLKNSVSTQATQFSSPG